MATKKIQQERNPHSLDVPTFFADQPATIHTGPYTTKITLGSVDDDGSDFPRPVVTIVMPTVNLIRMVEELHELVSSPDFQAESKTMLERDISRYYSLAKTKLLSTKSRLKRLQDMNSAKD